MSKQKRPNVVAELGRPETPGETAARKAENSRLYRERKTVNNLVLSLLVTLGLVAVIFLMVPQGKGDFADSSVDVSGLAADAEQGAGRPLAAPEVPETWKAKQAVLREDDGLVTWRLNYTTADGQYAAVVQAFRADGEPVDDEWIAEQLEKQSPTGSEQLAGVNWTVYEHTDRSIDDANMLFGLEGAIADNAVLVFGTDTPATIRVLATQVADSLAQ